ncbi:MAG: hypothetical protein BWY76_00060 [bacterium ADurb.Bin429]|nr:MAG: hypothetical protein BWY76_00060 [bacterium ADurb.Bin429]
MKVTLARQWRAVLLVLVALAVISLAGCRKPFGFFERPAPSPTPRTSSTQPRDLGRAAIQTVTDYVAALDLSPGHAPDYDAAYALLSRASQSYHSRAEFQRAHEAMKGMPQYDLAAAKTTLKGDTATVVVPLEEDPATSAFQLVLEGGAWKVVYRGGAPGMPYAE